MLLSQMPDADDPLCESKPLVAFRRPAMEALSLKLRQWCSRQPGTSEASAFSKGCYGLLGLAPANPSSLSRVASGPIPALAPLVIAVSALKGFLHEAAKVASQFATRPTNVAPPYIGGVVGAPNTAASGSCQMRSFCIGALNPGRSGLLSPHAHEVLWWRLIRITNKLVASGIDICFLPSWRWPQGVEILEDMGFQMLGIANAKWASIGALVSMQVAPLVHQLDAFTTDRTLWLAVNIGEESACILPLATVSGHCYDLPWSSHCHCRGRRCAFFKGRAP